MKSVKHAASRIVLPTEAAWRACAVAAAGTENLVHDNESGGRGTFENAAMNNI
jgi:hypothetical protein